MKKENKTEDDTIDSPLEELFKEKGRKFELKIKD